MTRLFVKAINLNPEKKDKILSRLKIVNKVSSFFPYKPKKGFIRELHIVGGGTMEIFKKTTQEEQNKSTPKKKPLPALPSKKVVYIVHGGAFVLDLIHIYRIMHAKYSDAGHGASVAMIDYRTAPDFTYPAAHDDTMAGWEFLLAQGYNPSDIVVVGDSAGGNIVLSMMLQLRDSGKPLPKAAVLISPWTDLLATGESYHKNYQQDPLFGSKKSALCDNAHEKFLKCGAYEYAKNAYRANPYLSHIYDEYHDFPPTLTIAGEYEILLDDAVNVHQKMLDAGCDAKLIIGEKMWHVYPLFYHASPTAKAAMKEVWAFISEHLW